MLLGNQITFSAAVNNATDTTVAWSVNGVVGGALKTGTITAAGVYTAPADLPTLANLQVSATSHADATKSGSATVTIQSDVSVALPAGGATVELGATRAFVAQVNSAAHPDTAVAWSLTGATCPLSCGRVDGNGNYTAPQILPLPTSLTLTARSVADASKSASTGITISSNFMLQLTVPQSVPVSGVATFIATMTPVPGSNPSMALAWNLSSSGCSGAACGTLAVVTIQSAGGNVTAVSASYTAPSTAPSPNSILVTVTPQADPTKAAQQSFAILGGGSGGVSVAVSPGTATRAINHRVTLTATVGGTANTDVTWNVNGVVGGNAASGLICVVGSNPCQAVMDSSAAQVDYLAPAAVPTPDPATVTAISAADATKSGSAQITVINHLVVTILPGSALVEPLGVQGFASTVLGTDNQNVIWQIRGTDCGVAGVCGGITSTGAYTAPSTPPVPDALQVVALSLEDPSQSGAADVTITTGANILTLHPSSVYAGAADGFTLKVLGSGFAPSSTGSGSVLLIGGTPRTTTCADFGQCTAEVTAAEVAVAGSVNVQVQNPDNTKSNAVTLLVEPPNVSDEVITLSAGAPDAIGKDIVVVEPTTAGVSVPGNDVDLDVAALGIFSVANNSCTLGGNPVTLTRPATGVAAADVCIFSESGLDTSMTYTVTGSGDVAVIAKQPVGLGIIRLTLQLPATAASSARTLFIQNTNLDKTAATGTLWVN